MSLLGPARLAKTFGKRSGYAFFVLLEPFFKQEGVISDQQMEQQHQQQQQQRATGGGGVGAARSSLVRAGRSSIVAAAGGSSIGGALGKRYPVVKSLFGLQRAMVSTLSTGH